MSAAAVLCRRPPLPLWSGLCLLLFFWGACLPVQADTDWDQLSAHEQEVLKPFRSQWDNYPAATRQTMQHGRNLPSSGGGHGFGSVVDNGRRSAPASRTKNHP
ncbi:MAG: hypothetical protein R3E89_00825 [Thiolinea sp.]